MEENNITFHRIQPITPISNNFKCHLPVLIRKQKDKKVSYKVSLGKKIFGTLKKIKYSFSQFIIELKHVCRK